VDVDNCSWPSLDREANPSAVDPEPPDELPKSGHRGEEERTVEGLKLPARPSQDAARICAELRASGIEVWFDQSELRGGVLGIGANAAASSTR
jgi:hypothetical protein